MKLRCGSGDMRIGVAGRAVNKVVANEIALRAVTSTDMSPQDDDRKPTVPEERATQKKNVTMEDIATAVSAPSKSVLAPVSNRTPTRTLADEQRLIESARRALNAKKSDRAIALLARHRRDFKWGQFVEEREVLRILALSQKGQYRAAKRWANRFLQKYPNTVFKDAVGAAISEFPQ